MIEIKWKFPFKIDAPSRRIKFFMDEKKPLYVCIGGPNVVQFYQKRRLMESDRTNLAPYNIFEVKLTGATILDTTYQSLGYIRRLMVGIQNSLPAGLFDGSRKTSLRREGIVFCSELGYVSDISTT